MSGENKHNSFFPPEDSPINVPPAEEAWSLMRKRLDGLMPVTATAAVKSTWLLRLSWMVPAAAVACVSVWLVVRKPGERHKAGVATGQVGVKRDAASGAVRGTEDSGIMANPGGLEKDTTTSDWRSGIVAGRDETTVGSARMPAAGGAGTDVAGSATGTGMGATGGAGATGVAGGSVTEAAGRSGTAEGMKSGGGGDAVNMPADRKVTTSGQRHGRVKMGVSVGLGESGGKGRRRIAPTKEATGRTGGAAAEGTRERPGDVTVRAEGATGRPGDVAVEGATKRLGDVAVQQRHQPHQGMASVPALAVIGQRHGSILPARLSSSLPAGLKAKVHRGKDDAGVQQSPVHNNERILAAGLWDGQNLAVSGQVVYRNTSSDGNGMVPDHLPGAYLRMYMGDRVYLEAGVRLYSPQYTRLERIDSTGGGTDTSGFYVAHLPDSIVTLEKLYYTDIPLTVHYRIVAGLYLGAGLQYSRLWDGAASQTIGGRGTFDLDLKNQPATMAMIRKNDWRLLLDADYVWGRFSLGVRYQQAIGSYLRTTEGGSKPRNSAVNLYLSYDIWRQRRK